MAVLLANKPQTKTAPPRLDAREAWPTLKNALGIPDLGHFVDCRSDHLVRNFFAHLIEFVADL